MKTITGVEALLHLVKLEGQPVTMTEHNLTSDGVSETMGEPSVMMRARFTADEWEQIARHLIQKHEMNGENND